MAFSSLTLGLNLDLGSVNSNLDFMKNVKLNIYYNQILNSISIAILRQSRAAAIEQNGSQNSEEWERERGRTNAPVGNNNCEEHFTSLRPSNKNKVGNVPKILATHAVQYEIDAEIRHKKLLSNTLADHKVCWILDFILNDRMENYLFSI